MQRITFSWTIILACVLGISTRLMSQQATKDTLKSTSRFELEPEFDWIVRAKRLLGTSVRSQGGNEIGTIRDLAFDLESGHAAMAVISLTDDSAVAVPFHAITFDRNGDSINGTVLKNAMLDARKLDVGTIERGLTRGWVLDRFKDVKLPPYYHHKSKVGRKETGAKPHHKKYENLKYPLTTVTKLWRVHVNSANGEKLGWIEDFAIAPRNRVIAYAGLAMDSKEPIPQKLYAIPLSAFVVKSGSPDWTIELPHDLVSGTSSFATGEWPTKLSRGWVEYVIERYNGNPLDGVEHELRATPNEK